MSAHPAIGEAAALRSETIDPLSDGRWQSFLEHSVNGSVFHHVEWLRLLHDQYRYSMLAHCVVDGRGEIVAGLPLARVSSRLTGTRLVALPFSDVCPPAQIEDVSAGALRTLLDAVAAGHERTGLDIEIRAELDGFGSSGASFHRHEIALEPDTAAVEARFAKMARRGVARARRNGVTVAHETDREALRTFFRLHLHTRRRQGMPTQPKRFIERFERLFERRLGFLLIARLDGDPLAAALFLSFNGVLTYKYGASDRRRLAERPNNAIFMEAIRWGCEHGQHMLDLGRTDLGNEGLRAFKRSWGADEQRLTYTHLPRTSATRSAPAGAHRALGAVISHTPALTSRLVGAALYRHFG